MPADDDLWARLTASGLLAPDAVDAARARQRDAGGPPDTAILEAADLDRADRDHLRETLAALLDLPVAPPEALLGADPAARALVPDDLCETHALWPLAVDADGIDIAAPPLPAAVWSSVAFELGRPVRPRLALEIDVRTARARAGHPLPARLAALDGPPTATAPRLPALATAPGFPRPDVDRGWSAGRGGGLLAGLAGLGGGTARTAAALAPGAPPTDWVSTGLEALRAEQSDGGRPTLDALAASVLDLRLFLARTDAGLRVVGGGGAPPEILDAVVLTPQASLDRALETGANRRGPYPEDADLDALYAQLRRPAPREVLVEPLRDGHRVVGVFVGDAGDAAIAASVATGIRRLMPGAAALVAHLGGRGRTAEFTVPATAPPAALPVGPAHDLAPLTQLPTDPPDRDTMATLGRTAEGRALPTLGRDTLLEVPATAPPAAAPALGPSHTIMGFPVPQLPMDSTPLSEAPPAEDDEARRTTRPLAELTELAAAARAAEAMRDDEPLRTGGDLDLRRTTPDLRALELQRVMDGAEAAPEPAAEAAPAPPAADAITATAAERPSVRAAALMQTAAERPSVRFRSMDIGASLSSGPQGPRPPGRGGARVVTLTPPPDDGEGDDFSAFTPTPAPAAAPPDAEALHDAVTRLADPDPWVREGAERLLLTGGEAALDALFAAFPGHLVVDRYTAHPRSTPVARHSGLLAALIRFGPAAVSRVELLCDHLSPEVRYYAAFTFSALRSPRSLARVGRLLLDKDPSVRDVTAVVIDGYRDTRAFDQVVEGLRRALDHGRPVQRRLAAETIGRLRMIDAAGDLVEALGAAEPALAEAAHRALVEITRQDLHFDRWVWSRWLEHHAGEPRVQWLIEGLASDKRDIRAASFKELRRVTHQNYGFLVDAPLADRRAAVERWRRWWEETGHARHGDYR